MISCRTQSDLALLYIARSGHGGGFVAQSSNSHLVYLKSFAKGVGAPIISIDYSLAPEAPYPRALHEAFYAYLWAMENAHLLGSTCEKIILAGTY